MIKVLRRKFVVTAMLSFLILITILIGCVTALGYMQMEKASELLLDVLSDNRQMFRRPAEPADPIFGYQVSPMTSFPAAHLIVTTAANGQIDSIKQMGVVEEREDDIADIVQQVIASGEATGKAGFYKYRVTEIFNGGNRIVFVDNSFQVRMLLNTLTQLCFVGMICMVLMFAILMLLSKRAINPIAVNMEKQKQFVTNAGHEIKTPLAIIMANVDALELNQGASKWSGHIRSQAERMTGLMRQMLLLAQADEGASIFTMEPVDLSAIVKTVADAFVEPAVQKQVQLKVHVVDGITINGSGEALEMMITVLLDNAVKYNHNNGYIEVSLSMEGRKRRLCVTNAVDELPNVAPDALFDRFYRANAARTQKDGGYGIGLSVAKALVQLHHGKITASYKMPLAIQFTVDFI